MDAGVEKGRQLRTAAEIEAWIMQRIAKFTGIPIAQISPSERFSAFGLDSLKAVTLIGDLEEWLGCELSPAMVWDYPVIGDLSRYLEREIQETCGG